MTQGTSEVQDSIPVKIAPPHSQAIRLSAISLLETGNIMFLSITKFLNFNLNSAVKQPVV